MTNKDIEDNKIMAGIAYIGFVIPLFVVTLILGQKSEYAKFHANQALILWIVTMGGNAVFHFIPFFGGFLNAIFSLVTLVMTIIGILNGFGGKAEELPFIGHFRIIS